MTKLIDLSTFKQAYYSFHTLFFHNRNFKRSIIKETLEYDAQYSRSGYNRSYHANTLSLQAFQDHSCLSRWGEVSDSQFGGSSRAELIYNDALRCLALKGRISMKDKDKLKNYPFLGLIQKSPFKFQTGMYNALRLQIIGDGHPIHCQIQVFCPFEGHKHAHAFLLSQKIENWVTYELPFRNFQLKGQQATNKAEFYDSDRKTMNNLIDSYQRPDFLQISKLSFRFHSKTSVDRLIYFKSIQLARTIRGERDSFNNYTKPYFYIIDPHQKRDNLLKSINVGDFQYLRDKS